MESAAIVAKCDFIHTRVHDVFFTFIIIIFFLSTELPASQCICAFENVGIHHLSPHSVNSKRGRKVQMRGGGGGVWKI